MTQANIVTDNAAHTKMANMVIIPEPTFEDHFEDSYISYACIYAGDVSNVMAESWSGNWNESTTKPAPDHLANKQSHSAAELVPYCIDSGCTSHCSPNHANFFELTPIPHHAIHGMNGKSIPAIA